MVMRILNPHRNLDYPQNVIDCSLARKLDANPLIIFLLIRGTNWHINQQDQKYNPLAEVIMTMKMMGRQIMLTGE